MRIPAEPWVREHVHRAADPVTPKHAATIAVVRDGHDGLEVFLMRRTTSMAFAAGMYVFPGGGVHDEDRRQVSWIGPDASAFAERFHIEAELAHALVVAAVRETFEETGVLLAGNSEGDIVSDASVFHDARLALERHELTFAEFLQSEQLSLRADLLGAWSHWITPAYEPRRYDTKFFVAALPDGQRIDTVSSEADDSAWLPIAHVLNSVDLGEVAMMPPTVHTCRQLSQLRAHELLDAASRRRIQTIEPVLIEEAGELFIDTGDTDFS